MFVRSGLFPVKLLPDAAWKGLRAISKVSEFQCKILCWGFLKVISTLLILTFVWLKIKQSAFVLHCSISFLCTNKSFLVSTNQRPRPHIASLKDFPDFPVTYFTLENVLIVLFCFPLSTVTPYTVSASMFSPFAIWPSVPGMLVSRTV